MKILAISDTHIGDPRLKNQEQITNLIKNTKFDVLVLNGDFLETWYGDYKTSAMCSPIVYAIRDIKKPVIWVRGNHDHISVHQNILPNAMVVDQHIELSGNKKILFMHGHQVYPFKNMAWWHKVGAIINSLIYRITKIDMQSWWREKSCYADEVIKKRENIINTYGKNIDVLVIGHTHIPIQQGKLYDGGSTMLTGHYIYIDDADISIKQL